MLHTFDVYLFCVVADQSFTDESSRTGGSSNADDEDQYGDSSMSNYVYLCLSFILTYIQDTCFNQSLRVKTNRKILNSSIYPRFRKGRFGKEREREKRKCRIYCISKATFIFCKLESYLGHLRFWIVCKFWKLGLLESTTYFPCRSL